MISLQGCYEVGISLIFFFFQRSKSDAQKPQPLSNVSVRDVSLAFANSSSTRTSLGQRPSFLLGSCIPFFFLVSGLLIGGKIYLLLIPFIVQSPALGTKQDKFIY